MSAYLGLYLQPQLLSFALLKVIHDHHRCIDLSNGHVCVWKYTHTSRLINRLIYINQTNL